jgi:hypothetical protein
MIMRDSCGLRLIVLALRLEPRTGKYHRVSRKITAKEGVDVFPHINGRHSGARATRKIDEVNFVARRANPESSPDRWIPGSSPSGRASRGPVGDAPE